MFAFSYANPLLSSYLHWGLVILLTISIRNSNTHEIDNQNVCSSPKCLDAASLIRENIDESYNPCNDFYKFACGGYSKNDTVSTSKHRLTALTKLNFKVEIAIRKLVEEPIKSNDQKIAKLVKNYYYSCLHENEESKNKSLTFLNDIITKFGGWPVLVGDKWNASKFDAFTVDAKLRQFGYRPTSIFVISVFQDIFNSSRRVLQIDPPDSKLGPVYLESKFNDSGIESYYQYMIDVAVILGADRNRATTELRSVVEFEKRISNIIPNSPVPAHSLIILTIKELQEKLPIVSWLDYINHITESTVHFTASDSIGISSVKYVESLIHLLRDTPKKIIANYMIWNMIEESGPYLTDVIRERTLDYQWGVSFAAVQKISKSINWRYCVMGLLTENSGLMVGVSSMYIRKHFNNHTKEVVENMVTSIADGLGDVLKNITWIDSATKAVAYQKKNMMKHIVGYPDELLNNEVLDNYVNSLSLDPNEYYQNYLRLQRFHFDFDLKSLMNSSAVSWVYFSDSTIVNAYYLTIKNSINIPAGLLQPPLFDPGWPAYIKYGSIGSIIGHEIMHAYDKIGIAFDETGTIKSWLSDSSKEEYNVRAQCFIWQYSHFKNEELGLEVHGAATLAENLADNFGALIAYRAYENWVERHGEEASLPNLKYNPKQLFWISAMNSLCNNDMVIPDYAHTADVFRVQGIAINSREFATAFNCPVGTPMNPNKKCEIW